MLPVSATNAARISRPSSERTGIFCRFGSEELRRPVARSGLGETGVQAAVSG